MNFLILSKIIAIQLQVTQVFRTVSSLSPIANALVVSYVQSKMGNQLGRLHKYLSSLPLMGFVLSQIPLPFLFWLQVQVVISRNFSASDFHTFQQECAQIFFKKSQRTNFLVKWSRKKHLCSRNWLWERKMQKLHAWFCA